MFFDFFSKFFGSSNDRVVRRCYRIVQEINRLEARYEGYSDEELRECTSLFREQIQSGKSLDDLLVEAFAVVREAAKRVYGLRIFDVQLVGGIVLHNGMISEMKTGEGKTLTTTLPGYLNALKGQGVHVVTVNDYLAKRDAENIGRLYSFLGLSTGCIIHGLSDFQRRQQYDCDVTYATNHELGFDYLRDNMKFRLSEMVMRPFNYGIVDEVDSILIDEARTPLIISGPAEDSSNLYRLVDKIVSTLVEEDFEKDIKQRSVSLTDQGVEKIEAFLKQLDILQGATLYDLHNISLVHHVNAALKAHKIFNRDVDYIVKDDKVMIIDEFTGRMMEGRRYSEGLHQALEAKEDVDIEQENQTLASITYQNFFRMYPKLAGMTGTALTEAAEFEEIYKLQVISIPTNVVVIRKDYDDEVYLTNEEKYRAVVDLIKDCQKRGQPVLVGTASIERSEYLDKVLTDEGIQHQVLNARYHEQEAYIIAEAGRFGAVTIATNMAGRGTDIKLGGNWEMRVEHELQEIEDTSDREKNIQIIKGSVEFDHERVLKEGGLFVIGTERHESRRIDNQLRGRSGRQGDPGASKFFVSLEDDLMKRFGSERLDAMLRRCGAKEGEVISHAWVNKSLERAQRKVEAHNFEIRKHLLKYDDVMNEQRKIVYQHRLEILKSESIKDMILSIREEVIERSVYDHMPHETLPDQWDVVGLHESCLKLLAKDFPIQDWLAEDGISQYEIINRLSEELEKTMLDKESLYGEDTIRSAERSVLLRILDQHWKDHLLTLDHLRQGINLRSYAQSNPLNEYKREAFNLFQTVLYHVKADVVSILSHFELQFAPQEEEVEDVLDPHLDFGDFGEETPEWKQDPLYQDQETYETLFDEKSPFEGYERTEKEEVEEQEERHERVIDEDNDGEKPRKERRHFSISYSAED